MSLKCETCLKKQVNYGVNAPLALLNHPSIAYRRQRDELIHKVVNFGMFLFSLPNGSSKVDHLWDLR